MPESVVEIVTSRDQWLEQSVALAQLYAIPAENTVIIDLRNEGISLTASGLLHAIDTWVAATGRDPNTVSIRTPNIFEPVHYRLIGLPHFLHPDYFGKYLVPTSKIDPRARLFGFFVGGHTAEREIIAQDIHDLYLENFLVSVMRNRFPNRLWPTHIWNLGSLDNFSIQDQYEAGPDTNRSLLQFYDRFQIELVAESMTRGPTFFPTEKTVRPIVGCRPFLTFAPKGYMQNMKKMGFQTFDSLWSEDYDQLEGPARWQAMRAVIEHVIEHGYDCNRAQDIVKYNYHHLGTLQLG